MAGLGVNVGRPSIRRWAIKILIALATLGHRRKHAVGEIPLVDETHIRVDAKWKQLFCAVDKKDGFDKFLAVAESFALQPEPSWNVRSTCST